MVSYVRGRGIRTLSDAEIVAQYLAGTDATTVGAGANCSADTVLYLVRRAGGTVRRPGGRVRKVLPLDDAQIVRLYREGLSGPEIADRCGTTAVTIYKILEANSVPRRSCGEVSKAMYAAARSRRPPP